MGETAFDAAVLAENLRCKVIYYSCITPNTISDMNRAWGYGSPTYLYQNDSMERLKDADLITVEKVDGKNIITASYDALFGDDNRERGRRHVNQEIVKAFLVHAKGFQPRQEHRQDEEDLLSIARGNLDDELEQNLQAIEFDRQEYAKLTRLWRNPVFKDAFLSLECTSNLFGHRKSDLPDNPLDYLFALTAGVITAMGRGRAERGLEIPPALAYHAERVIIPAYRTLDSRQDQDSEVYAEFVSEMNTVYSMFRTKFQADRFHYGFLQDFVEAALQDDTQKKFGQLFDSVRGDNGFF